MNKPYNDHQINSSSFYRTFDKNVLDDELEWHRDENDRIVTVMLGKDWELQLENSLPTVMKEEDQIFIPAKSYHRIKRGTTNLTVRIEEFK